MTEHAWVEEHTAAYVAGGLNATETEQLETHIRDCSACADAVANAKKFDEKVSELFAGVHAGPEVEDRAVNRTRQGVRREPLFGKRVLRVAASLAALVLFGTVGAITANRAGDALPMPGSVTWEWPSRGDVARESMYAELSLQKAEQARLEAENAQREAVAAKLASDQYTQTTLPPANGSYGSAAEQKYKEAIANLPPNVKTQVDAATAKYEAHIQDFTEQTKKDDVMYSGYASGTLKPGSGMVLSPDPKQPGDPKSEWTVKPGGYPSYPTPPVPTPVPQTPPVTPVVTPVTVNPQPQPPTDPTDPEIPKPAPGTEPQPKPEAKQPPKLEPPKADPVRRVILRTGEIEFEIPSFDAALAAITKLANDIDGAFVATVNSQKLPNGKVQGTITVRVPPEHLDGLVLDLRKEIGETGVLKGVRIASQDVTKEYYDLESRLRGARTMEERLLKIIQEGKGEIKELLEAERELGVWRTKIEEFEGQLRYYAALAALSSLTITLTETDIRVAAEVTEKERVQAGVEVEDVDAAYQELLKAIMEAKGHITQSEVKQQSAGQFSATMHFEVPQEISGPIRDRLKQLGRVSRLEIDRVVEPEGGTLPKDAKPKRGDTVFLVQLYNLANIAPRETATIQLAVQDVAQAYHDLRNAVTKAAGRVMAAQLNEQDTSRVTAQIDFEVKRTEEGVVRLAVEGSGEVYSRHVSRAAESDNVTDTKVLYKISIFGVSQLTPRETHTLHFAAPDVPEAYSSLKEAVAKTTTGRVLSAQLNEQDRTNITGQFDFEIQRTEENAVRTAIEAAGEVISRQVTRATEGQNVTDTKVLYRITLLSASKLKPREITVMTVEVPDVDQTAAAFAAHVAEAKGRQVDSQSKREPSGKVTATLAFEVPLTAAAGLVERFKSAGVVQAFQSVKNQQASDGKYAIARIDVTVTNPDAIVPDDEGLWPQVRRGLSYSISVLLTSVTWVVFGLCVVLPWAVIAFVVYRAARRTFRSSTPPPAA